MASTSTVTSINDYILESDLQNANSGFSKWGFATKDSKEFFIKELITPVYPVDSSNMSEALFEKKRMECQIFENRYKKLYQTINDSSDGILIRINDFFRYNSRYYVVTERVRGAGLSMEQIAALPEKKKLLLMLTAAKGFYNLHTASIVHFDVKPSNILVKMSDNGNPVAKLIDFDSGFFIDEDMNGKELGGDLTYLAPETFWGISGEATSINGKADIFALGLVFHEYFCGRLPYFDENEFDYPFEAVLEGHPMGIMTDRMPPAVAELLTAMVAADPVMRPTTEQIIVTLSTILYGAVPVLESEPPTSPIPDPIPNPTPTPNPTPNPTRTPVDGSMGNWFGTAGDL